jgi:hypothetical protein
MLFPLELLSHLHDPNTSSLGQEYVVNDAGLVSPVNAPNLPAIAAALPHLRRPLHRRRRRPW